MSNAAAQREQALRLVSQQMMKAIDSGLIRLRVEDQARDGRTITVKGRELVNFGSAAYLGLNTDERLKEGARAAIDPESIERATTSRNLACPTCASSAPPKARSPVTLNPR